MSRVTVAIKMDDLAERALFDRQYWRARWRWGESEDEDEEGKGRALGLTVSGP